MIAKIFAGLADEVRSEGAVESTNMPLDRKKCRGLKKERYSELMQGIRKNASVTKRMTADDDTTRVKERTGKYEKILQMQDQERGRHTCRTMEFYFESRGLKTSTKFALTIVALVDATKRRMSGSGG